MRLRGRLWLVVVFVCLGLMPARSEAAPITLTGTFTQDSDVVFAALTITETSELILDVTAGFMPIVTLFGPVTDPTQVLIQNGGVSYQWITDFTSFDDSILLNPAWTLQGDSSGTQYLLALSQFPNYFDPIPSAGFPGGFAAVNDPDFLRRDFPECDGFVDAAGACGDGAYSAQFDAVSTSVPEPATLSLLALGGAALVARRRGRAPGDT